MKTILYILAIVGLFLSPSTPGLVSAKSGLPNSSEFGYGVRLDLSGTQINPSISAAASMKINWLALDFDWAEIWPVRDGSPNLEPLNQAMVLAQQNQLSVMISIIKPPTWAVNPDGPDQQTTIQVIKYLARTYPGVLLAIELFPGANTVQGWGTNPDPVKYAKLLQAANKALRSINSSVVLIAGGLTPLPPKPTKGDIDDLKYLDDLYDAGAIAWMPIISVQLPEITGDPMLSPTPGEKRCLRHFEEVRQVMVDNDHREGLVWISGFSWPSGKIKPSDSLYRNQTEQTRWMNQAYQIMRSQLYLGVAFFSFINPPGPRTTVPNPSSLIHADLSIHPAFINLGQLISPPADNSNLHVQTVLVKRIVQDIQFKPSTYRASTGQ